jgi:hypothetical protein
MIIRRKHAGESSVGRQNCDEPRAHPELVTLNVIDIPETGITPICRVRSILQDLPVPSEIKPPLQRWAAAGAERHAPANVAPIVVELVIGVVRAALLSPDPPARNAARGKRTVVGAPTLMATRPAK